MVGHAVRNDLSFIVMKVFGEWMTVAEAATRLTISTRRVHQLIASGRLEAEKVGRDTFVRRHSVELLKRQPRRPGRPSKEV